MKEMKRYHRNKTVTFYDYKKAFDKVYYHWMLRVYRWKGVLDELIKLISNIMELWKTRVEIWSNRGKLTIIWLNISCGFLQGDSYSPVGFFVFEILACRILHQRENGLTRKQRCQSNTLILC